jgi:ABC-type phosphate transport system permease subunit
VPDVALAACLVLVVALVLTSVMAFARSHRNEDPLGSLIGFVALLLAGVPAVAYGASTSF